MNNLCDFSQSKRSRFGEAVLWASAAAMMLSVHAGAAVYMMQPSVQMDVEDGPPPAIMIEMAALPEAVNVEDTTETNDAVDSAEVQSDTLLPVEELPPPEPLIEEVKQPEPGPIPEPEPVQEVAEPEPVELPEPIEEIDPIENQMMAALENVEVPLPVLRPPPPPKEEKKVVEQKKPEPKPERKKVEQPKPKPPASKAAETAKANVAQSNRNVAATSGASNGSSQAEITRWESKVRTAISRRKPRSLRGNGLTSTVQFRVADNGALSGVSIVRSSGDSAIDRQILSWVSGVGRVPAPPPGAAKTVTIPIAIR